MDTILSPLHLLARRETLRYAVQTSISCPHSGVFPGVSTLVLLEDTKRSTFAISCFACSERAPFDGKQGCVEVYDGRLLFPKRKKGKAR